MTQSKREFSVGTKVVYGARKGEVIAINLTTRMLDVKFEDGSVDDVHVSTLEVDEDVSTPAQHLYAPMNRPVEEAAPKGYTVVSGPSDDFTYGVISYDSPLSPLDQWKYEFQNLTNDYQIGEIVAYVLNGKVYTGEITSMEDTLHIYVDDYECLPYWKLARQ
jgi:hypothetical protein